MNATLIGKPEYKEVKHPANAANIPPNAATWNIFKENGLLQTQEVEDNNDIEDSMDKVNIEPLEDTGGREEIPNQTDHTNIVTDVDNILVTYLQAEIHRLKDENSKLRQALTILTTT